MTPRGIAGAHLQDWKLQMATTYDYSGQLCELTADPAKSATLPGWAYTDPAFFERERHAIHYRSWHYAGALSELAGPGDYITARILDQSVIVIRDKNGELGGFYNVCQHRAHELLRGRGKVRVITCPYHAWSYGTDGHLRAARGSHLLPDFPAGDFALKPVRVEIFAEHFVFFNLDLDAAPLAEQAVDLAVELRNDVVGFDELVVMPGVPSGPMQANWKVAVDNYLECYHCSIAHPALAELLDMRTYRVRVKDCWMGQKIGLRRGDNSAYPVAPDAPVQQAQFWWLWPTTTFNVLPGSVDLSVFSFMPTGVGSTLQVGQCFSPPDAVPDEARHSYRNGLLTDEDVRLCESVQRGLSSRGYSAGRLIYDPEGKDLSEGAVHRFQFTVARATGLI